MKKLIIFIIILLLTQSFNFPQQEQITIPLSKPNDRGILIINHVKGSIHVQGYDGKVVIIEAKNRYNSQKSNYETSSDGLKKIPLNKMKLEASEEENNVIIKTNSHSKTIDLEIKVPINFDLKLKTIDNGNISVKNVHGNLEISNVEGDIILKDIFGTVVSNTIDGNIIATFKQVYENTPMAFSTVDGKIDLKFPPKINALIKMKSDYGEVFSDFNFELLERKKKIQKDNERGLYSVTIEEWTYAKLNNGGPEIMIKTLDGNIYIRKGN